MLLQCPDPHFKKKYHKRRVVQKHLVESIVDCLMPGGQVCGQNVIFAIRMVLQLLIRAIDICGVVKTLQYIDIPILRFGMSL